MFKLLLTGVWVCAVTLGTVYFSVQMATRPPATEETKKRDTEVVKGEPITVPLIADGAVKGYFVSRISFIVDKEKLKDGHPPTTEIMTDELFTLLVGNEMVDIGNVGAFDIGTFRESIKTDLNHKLGEGIVAEVLVEQLDYLSKEDIRSSGNTGRAPKSLKIAEGEALPEAPKSGH